MFNCGFEIIHSCYHIEAKSITGREFVRIIDTRRLQLHIEG